MEDRLHKFARLVDSGSFTRASEELHISQPALSMAINKLERELSAELIIRSGHKLQMTPAGNYAYAAAKELGILSDNLKVQLLELSEKRPSVRIGMIDSIASTVFSNSEKVSDLERNADLSVVVNNSRYLLNAIQHDRLDIAFVVEKPELASNTLDVTRIAAEPLVLVCHSKDFSSAKHSLRQGQLPRFMSYDQASSTRQLIEAELIKNNLLPRPSFYSTSPEVIVRLLLIRKGISVLPYSLVKNHLADNTLAVLGFNKPIIIERHICSIKRRGKHLVNPIENVQAQVRELLDNDRRKISKYF